MKESWLDQEVFISTLILNREICPWVEILDGVIDKTELEIVSNNRIIMRLRMTVQLFMKIEVIRKFVRNRK